MVKRIKNTDNDIASQIYSVFQASYKVEAELLNAIDFPPLLRTVNSFLTCNNTFLACFRNNKISGVIEVESHSKSTHIQSLVVHPKEFRKGIARELIAYVLNNYKSELYTVETGLNNYPAIQLYKGFDFKEIKQWDTDHGVRKVRLEKVVSS